MKDGCKEAHQARPWIGESDLPTTATLDKGLNSVFVPTGKAPKMPAGAKDVALATKVVKPVLVA